MVEEGSGERKVGKGALSPPERGHLVNPRNVALILETGSGHQCEVLSISSVVRFQLWLDLLIAV